MAAGGSADDTALLALRLDPATPEPLEVAVQADASQLATLRRRLAGWLREAAGAGSAGEDVVLAGSEAAANCVEHAYRRHATGRDPHEGARRRRRRSSSRSPTPGAGAPSPAPGDRGRGLGMMRALMDDVDVRTDAAGTVVRMSRRLGRGPPAAGRPAAERERGVAAGGSR